jgi:hypothetical protein
MRQQTLQSRLKARLATLKPLVMEGGYLSTPSPLELQHAWRHRAPMPLALTDAEYSAVLQAAGPINPALRDAFLQALATELEKYPVVGPGVVFRCAAELQKRFGVTAHHEALLPAEPRKQARA